MGVRAALTMTTGSDAKEFVMVFNNKNGLYRLSVMAL
jgi:hypothetical protein